jgi:capsule polysaccharide modification protein KpsS
MTRARSCSISYRLRETTDERLRPVLMTIEEGEMNVVLELPVKGENIVSAEEALSESLVEEASGS